MDNNEILNEITSEELSEILRVRREKLNVLIERGQNPFELTKFEKTHSSKQILEGVEGLMGTTVACAGRIMSRRIMGKASFTHIQDNDGKIQIYLKADILGQLYEDYKKYFDIGDIVGVVGEVFVTHKGETSINVHDIVLLSKSLSPLPEKFHGLRDNDLRYRQRYLDLIVNPEVKTAFINSSKIISRIRKLLENEQFLEVQTPVLSTVAGGAAARPFITRHNTLELDMYLRIAPELYLKRLIIGGFERVYEIGRVFRNEGMSIKHNPEFTILELYQAYANLFDMMDLTTRIFKAAANEMGMGEVLSYQGTEINIGSDYEKISMLEAVKRYTDLDLSNMDLAQAKKAAKDKGFDLQAQSWGHALNELFEQAVEDKLIQPTFIYDYPIEISPLAKSKKDDKRLVERFEFFIYGREMANAYSELNDPIDQKDRFLMQGSKRADDENYMPDDEFVEAMEYGMPPTGGLGIGIDRMLMLFTDSASIRDVILFPTMKPKKLS